MQSRQEFMRHGHFPASIRDCMLKHGKDIAQLESYRAIELDSNFSELFEWCLLLQFPHYFCTSDLQFCFKSSISTSLCTGTIKNVVARYIRRKTPIFACFLDASKAFDLVNHDLLFQLLLDIGMSVCVVRLVRDWHVDQKLSVRWNSKSSYSFNVSNGVRQGGVLSPVLFTIYIDKLLLELRQQGVGCYWNSYFAGAYAYADDLAILAPLHLLSDRC